jgi:hypothetical protein
VVRTGLLLVLVIQLPALAVPGLLLVLVIQLPALAVPGLLLVLVIQLPALPLPGLLLVRVIQLPALPLPALLLVRVMAPFRRRHSKNFLARTRIVLKPEGQQLDSKTLLPLWQRVQLLVLPVA